MLLEKEGKIFILNMGKSIKIIDLAKKMCIFFGYNLVDEKKKKNDLLLKIVGLNKGEKIKEKLFTPNENFEESSHPLILKGKNEIKQKINIVNLCRKLIRVCDKNDIRDLQKLLKKNPLFYLNKQ